MCIDRSGPWWYKLYCAVHRPVGDTLEPYLTPIAHDLDDSRLTSILVSRFMLDLQRVKQRMEGPSSVGDLRSLSFNRFDAALGSVGAALEPGDIWGDGAPEDEDAEEDQLVSAEEGDYHASGPSPRSAGCLSSESYLRDDLNTPVAVDTILVEDGPIQLPK